MNPMTPNQAAHKLCPLKFGKETLGDEGLCDSTRCMAWGWYDPATATHRLPVGEKPGFGWKRGVVRDGIVTYMVPICETERRGYCAATRPDSSLPGIPHERISHTLEADYEAQEIDRCRELANGSQRA